MTIPVKCPICEGKGKVAPQFYPGDEGDDWKECRACKGNGTLWGFDAAPVVPAPQPYPVPYPMPYPVYPRPQPTRWWWSQPYTTTITSGQTITSHELPSTGAVQNLTAGPVGMLSATLND